jgi:hypothetical protein
VNLCIQTGDDMGTHTSSFASIFFCFFDFRLSTFSHCASSGSPSGSIISESETWGDLFCFFAGADEDEEGRFMAVAFWDMEPLIGPRAPNWLSLITMGGGQTESHSDYPEHNFSPGAKWIKSLTRDRTANFSGGHFSDVNLSSVLFTHRLDDSKHVQLQRWSAQGISKPTFQEAVKQDFQPAKKGESIGPSCE